MVLPIAGNEPAKKIPTAKIMWSVIILVLYGVLSTWMTNALKPLASNAVALGQLSNTPESFVNWQTYNTVCSVFNWSWLVIIAIILLIFKKEIFSAKTATTDSE
ncbi:MAG: hypothetical protein WCO23_04770 [bacterium]